MMSICPVIIIFLGMLWPVIINFLQFNSAYKEWLAQAYSAQ